MNYTENTEKYVGDSIASLNWLNILPSLQGKRVLLCNFEKNKRTENFIHLQSATLQYVDFFSLEKSKKNIFLIQKNNNICIINVLNKKHFSISHFKKNLQILKELLRTDGLLILIIPSGFQKIKFKIFIKKILRSYGLKNIKSYLCIPSFKEPYAIYYVSDKSKLPYKLFSNQCVRNFSKIVKIEKLIKQFIKYLCARFFSTVNLFSDTIIISCGSNNHNININFNEPLIKIINDNYIKNEYYINWLAKSFKYIGLFYGDNKNHELLAVCKKTFSIAHRSNCIKEEHDKLTLMSVYRNELRNKKIEIPSPIYFESEGGNILSIETAIHGQSLEKCKWKLTNHKENSNFFAILDELVNIQIYFQNLLSSKHVQDFPKLSNKYFINTTQISHSGLDNLQRVDAYAGCVQHGDFTDVNIMYNSKDNLWGIIDWEWSASGFPFLFDLFHLFTSLEFRSNMKKNEFLFNHYYKSNQETFFENNVYSNYIQKVILNYCDYFCIKNENVFQLYLDFLLFHYNKYYYDFHEYNYSELYKKNILFSINNQNKFITYNCS